MKKLTVTNYKQDKYYPKVVKAMNDELVHSIYVSPIVVFQRMALLEKKDIEEWRKGKVPYLEKVINCNLDKTSRILRLMGFHAHDLNMKPSNTVYKRKTRGGKVDLIFSKTDEPSIEKAYSRHFVKIGGTQSANKKIEADQLRARL